ACCAVLLIALGILAVLKTKRKSIINWLIYLVAILTGFLPVVIFHHVFRASTFESYVTRRFNSGSEEAIRLIATAIPPSARDSLECLRLVDFVSANENAEKPEMLLKRIDEALDADPYSAKAYLVRGRIRLYKSELTEQNKLAAIKDFTNALRLDSSMAAAYFYRAQAKSCLDPQVDFCADLKSSILLDSSWHVSAREIGGKKCPELSGGPSAR
ncbi:MAG: hypothetical protein ACKOQ6_07700, partial [Bacteroidota bacterium]